MKKTNLFKGLLLGGVLLSASMANAQTWLGTGAAGNTGPIYRSGNVGIGTTSDPTSPLSVVSVLQNSISVSATPGTGCFGGTTPCYLGNPGISFYSNPANDPGYSVFRRSSPDMQNGFYIQDNNTNNPYTTISYNNGRVYFGKNWTGNSYYYASSNPPYMFTGNVGIPGLVLGTPNGGPVTIPIGYDLYSMNGVYTPKITIGNNTGFPTTNLLNVAGNVGITGNRISMGGNSIRGSYSANDFAMELQGTAFSGLSIISDINGSNSNSLNIFSSAANNSAGIVLGKSGTSSNIPFSIMNGSAKLQVNPNGNIGIGTMAVPNSPLHVQSTGDISYVNIATTSTANKRTRLNFSQTNATGVNTLGMEIGSDYFSNNTNDLYIYSRTSNKLVSHFHGTSGNVGIGAAADASARLFVSGNTKVTGSGEFNMYDGQTFNINNSSSQAWGTANNYNIWFGRGNKAAMTLIKPGNPWWHMSSEAGGSLVFSTGGNPGDSPLLSLTNSNQVTIGTAVAPAGYKLAVDGAIICQNKVQVCNTGGWCDYVFEPNYELLPLEQLDGFIQANKHLPEIPSAAVVEKDGVDLMKMNKLLLKKVEELTLYTIDQEKRLKALENKK